MIPRISAFLLVLAALAVPAIAQASVCSIFYTWLTGDTITATRLNGNNTNFQTCGNNIDNSNIGSAGIYPSQLKPDSTAHGTFGGTFGLTELISMVVDSNSDATTPLVVNGNSVTQSNPLVDINQSSAGTNVLDVSSTGTLALRVTTDASVVFKIQGNSATQSGDILDAFQSVGGTPLAKLSNIGGFKICPTIAAANLCAPVAPNFSPGGGARGASYHVVGPFTFLTTLASSCGVGVSCSLTSSTQSLSGAGSFLDATYLCTASSGDTSDQYAFSAVPATLSTITMTARNITNASIASGNVQATVVCGGS